MTSEVHALLVCARVAVGTADSKELAAALGECPSVERLCDIAVRHRMLGHLHRALHSMSSPVEAGLVRRVDGLQHAVALRSTRQTGQLLRILGVLEAVGIAALPFKGPAWAQILYGESTLRHSTDIDLLVSPEDAISARQTLVDAGFVDLDPFNVKMLTGPQRVGGQIALRGADADLLVDLHWRINVALGHQLLDHPSVLSRAATVELLGRPVTCPGRLDVFLITCMEGTRDRWDSVGRLLDLGVQIQSMPRGDWDGLIGLAVAHGVRRRTLIGIDHVCRTLQLEMPASIAGPAAEDRVVRSLARSLQSDALVDRPPDGLRERLVLLRWNSATEDTRADWLSQAAARLFLPTSEDWRTLALPKWLDWLYYPLRPLRLAGKWVRRSLRGSTRSRRAPQVG